MKDTAKPSITHSPREKRKKAVQKLFGKFVNWKSLREAGRGHYWTP
jgi:hypothetical protein